MNLARRRMGRSTGVAGGGLHRIPWYLAAGINPDTIFGAYQFVGATSEANALKNLLNPGTNDLIKGASPVFNTSTGFMCTGSNFLRTGFIPAGKDYFAMVSFNTEETANYYPIFGVYDTTFSNSIAWLDAPGSPGNIQTMPASINSSPFMQNGILCICNKGFYRDGIFVSTTATFTAVSSYECYLGNINNAGSIYASLPKKLYLKAAILCTGAPSNINILNLKNKMAALPGVSKYPSSKYNGFITARNKRFSVMGDSIGTSVAGYWTTLAAENLNKGKGYSRVINHSVVGYTIGSHIVGQASTISGDDPDYVIVFLGTNDTASSDYSGLLTKYKSAIDIYLANSPNLTSANIFCMGILNKTTQGNRTQINTQVIQQAAIDKGCTFVSTEGWLTAPDDFSDGLHPTLAGHAKIMVAMASVLP